MKKLSFFAVALMACLGFSACSSDDFAPNVNSEGLTVVSHAKMVMTFGDGAETRATYTDGTGVFAWAVGDKIVVASNGQINGVITCTSATSGTGTFEGALNDFTPESVNLFYLGGEEATSMAPTIDFSTQTGDVTKFVVLKKTGLALTKNSDGDYVPSGNDDVKMTPVTSILNLDLTCSATGVSGKNAYKATLSDVRNSLTINLASGEVTVSSTPGTISCKPSSATLAYTIGLPAQEETIPSLTADYLGGMIATWSDVDLTAVAGKRASIKVSSLTTPNITGTPTTGTEKGHAWVQLWKDGPKWATCNVGATSPDGYGNYYAWGETTTKDTYSSSTYTLSKGSSTTMTKYCTSSDYGTVDNKTVLEAVDDAATANWGGNWRMPTYYELDKLKTECTWTRYNKSNTEFNGVAGYKVTSNKEGYTDNYIFLPAAGGRSGSSLYDVVTCGHYWSRSLSSFSSSAYCISFEPSKVNMSNGARYYGRSVRAVCQ